MGALFEQTHKQYSGNYINIIVYILSFSSFKEIISLFLFIISVPDLPEGTKVLDVNEVINLDTGNLQTETTGEKIVKEIQEWLLTQTDSEESAVLPEDATQHLLVGVNLFLFHCYQLQVNPTSISTS